MADILCWLIISLSVEPKPIWTVRPLSLALCCTLIVHAVATTSARKDAITAPEVELGLDVAAFDMVCSFPPQLH